MTKLVDSAAGTFTASYDLEGHITSEIYPNGMCANTSYNSTGTATSVSYIKTRNCSEAGAPVWFSNSIVPGIHGETLSQESTLAKESYAYDNAGGLTEAQETPAGKGCIARLYAYNEEADRLSLTTREPAAEGKCASEGGSVQRHVYDEANRLTDEGIEYESLGNTTKLPATDAGGKEIKSSFYVDGQAATQEQNGIANSYIYDPAGRTMETTSENIGTKASSISISHYAAPGEVVTWTSEGAEKWSRNIPGIGGALQATEASTNVITLQLSDLQGNIVATAADNETETKLLTTYNSTEYGVPTEGKTPPKYAWLGASGLTTETAFGTGIATEGGASYVPQVARDLQTAPVVPPGAFPNGQGTGEQYGSEIPGWYITLSSQESAATLAEYTAKQEALAREVSGGPIDPEGLMTGKEAQEFEHTLNQAAQYLEGLLELGWCHSEGCTESVELGIKGDKYFAKQLHECYFQVHNPHWLKREKVLETRMCLVHFGYEFIDGWWAIKPAGRVTRSKPGIEVSYCTNYYNGKLWENEWYCYDDSELWKYHPGWVEKIWENA